MIKLSSFIILFFLVITTAQGEDLAFFEKNLGKAPEGYSWTLCHNGFLAIRKPEGWFFKEEGPSAKGTMACFISKEAITSNSDFKTGFTINILTKFQEKSGERPSEYMKRFIAKMAKETKEAGEKIDQYSPPKDGIISSIALRTTRNLTDKQGKNPVLTTVHHFLAANDNTSTLYISSFESPADEWDDAWKTGEKIVELVGFLSNK